MYTHVCICMFVYIYILSTANPQFLHLALPVGWTHTDHVQNHLERCSEPDHQLTHFMPGLTCCLMQESNYLQYLSIYTYPSIYLSIYLSIHLYVYIYTHVYVIGRVSAN